MLAGTGAGLHLGFQVELDVVGSLPFEAVAQQLTGSLQLLICGFTLIVLVAIIVIIIGLMELVHCLEDGLWIALVIAG